MGRLSFRLANEKWPARTYLINEVGSAVCKVGIAERPHFRVKEMQTGNPRLLKLVATWAFICSADAYLAEQLTIAAAANSQIRGEWLNAEPEALFRFITRIHRKIITKQRIVVPYKFAGDRQLQLHNRQVA